MEPNVPIINHGKWDKINGTYFVPSLFPRIGHTTVMFKNSLFIYGGMPD